MTNDAIAELIGDRFVPWLADEPGRILDLCAGSGCIGIACAAAFPDAHVDAVEIDPRALQLLRANVARHELGDRVTVIASDLFDGVKGLRTEFSAERPWLGKP